MRLLLSPSSHLFHTSTGQVMTKVNVQINARKYLALCGGIRLSDLNKINVRANVVFSQYYDSASLSC